MTETVSMLSTVKEVTSALKDKPGALLPILHDIQNVLGYIPADSIPIIASELRLSRAEVHGVISFYHYFRETPPGKQTIHLCRAESCQAMGSKKLEEHVKAKLGIDYHETTPDGKFSLEPVYCLGMCSCSPSMQIGEDMYGRVTAESFDNIVKEMEAQS